MEPYLSLGDIYLQLDMPRDAIETYNNLLEHRPGPRILANLAWACAKAGMLDEAIDIREADINDPTVNKLPLLGRLKESMPDPVDTRSG